MADGSIVIDIDVSKQKAEKSLDDLKKNIDEFGKDTEESANIDLGKLSNELEKASTNFEKAKIKSKQLKDQLQDMENLQLKIPDLQDQIKEIQEGIEIDRELFASDDIGIDEYVAGINRAKKEISELQSEIDTLRSKDIGEVGMDKLRLDLEASNRVMSEQAIKMDVISNKASNMSTKLQPVPKELKKGSTEAKVMATSMNSANTSAKSMGDNVSKGVNKIVRYGMALFSIRSVYGALRNLSQEWLQSDQAGARQVQANIGAIKGALANSLAPVITWISNMIMQLVGYANALLKAFFGVDLFAKSTAKNTSKVAGGVKKANKELKKFTAGFDEAEVLSEQIADNLDGAGGGGGLDELPTPKIPTPDISGFMSAMEKIKNFWEGIWALPVVQAMLNLLTTAFIVFGQSLISIAKNYTDNIVDLFQAMWPFIEIGLQNVHDYWTLVFNDLADFIKKWVPIITESFNSLVSAIFKTWTPLFVWLARMWSEITGFMLETWIKYGAKILDEIGKFINGSVETFKLIWDLIIDPIIKVFLDELIRLWDTYLKDIVADIIDFVGEVTLRFLQVWNDAIKPFIDNMVRIFGPVITTIFDLLTMVAGSSLEGVIVAFQQLWYGIKLVLNGILDFIEGVFTGNWKKAWEGLQWILEGVFNGLGAFVKAPLNAIIGMVNGLIRGLNKIKLPSFLGGGGVNLPQIPYLAQGGVLTQPTLNLAGEYPNAHRNPEIVTPENKMREAMADVLSKYGGAGGGTYVFQSVLDGRVVAETVKTQDEMNNLQLNGAI